ncbi:Beta-lactamase [Arthrobotrys entomopaga]|nr:Beta-lactamase [Arthrobotrys entomopaga]
MEFFQSQKFASRVDSLMSQHHVPGLAIAIVQNGQISSAAYGKASLEPPVQCTTSTIFDIASCSKSLTAASVALLVADNENYPEVQYDTPMCSLLPEDFQMQDVVYTEGITIEDILSHRTGMAAHNCSYMGIHATKPDNARSITRNLRNLPVAAPLRSRYLYCNMMYTVATHLVEEKTKETFSDFLEKRFFEPLGMSSTHLQPSRARDRGLGDRIASGYYWSGKSSGYRGFQSPDCPEGQGAGSIMSSADDFIKWVKALMDHEGPVSEKVYRGLVRTRSFPNPNGHRLKPFTSPAMYAAGMEVYYYRGYMVAGHDGDIAGFGSRFFFMPDLNFGVVILGNSSSTAPVASTLARELMDAALEIPQGDRQKRAKVKIGKKPIGSKSQINSSSAKGTPSAKADVNKDGSSDPSCHNMPQKQERPLAQYTGKFWHPGYRELTVQVKDDQLFVDASNRSMGFTLKFDHIRDQTKYLARLIDSLDGGEDPLDAEFVFEGDSAVKMGLKLEASLKELIWFERHHGRVG